MVEAAAICGFGNSFTSKGGFSCAGGSGLSLFSGVRCLELNSAGGVESAFGVHKCGAAPVSADFVLVQVSGVGNSG